MRWLHWHWHGQNLVSMKPCKVKIISQNISTKSLKKHAFGLIQLTATAPTGLEVNELLLKTPQHFWVCEHRYSLFLETNSLRMVFSEQIPVFYANLLFMMRSNKLGAVIILFWFLLKSLNPGFARLLFSKKSSNAKMV